MKQPNETTMGKGGGAFLTTHWSLIGEIQSERDEQRVLIGRLLEYYWKPVYCYVRRKGYDNEQGKDLTQDFFCEVVLNRNLTQRADRAKGRFRSFLLHALNQYLTDQLRIASSKKRSPGTPLVSLDRVDPPAIPAVIAEAEPEQSYHYAWKTALLDRVLSEVEADCLGQGLETHWHLFNDKVVRPILENAPTPTFRELCRTHDVKDEAKASNMMITVKRRFQAKLREHVRNTVMHEDQVEGELKEIVRLFPKPAQDSE